MNNSDNNCTVMFADIAGSTALYDALGDTEAKKRIDDCLQSMIDITKNHHGVVIKTIGDEIMCHYLSVDDAVNAACNMHNYIDKQAQFKAVSMAIRIGLHTGKIIRDKGDIFGDTVNVAAKIANFAKARQILTSNSSIEQLSDPLIYMTRAYDVTPLKGKKTDLHIWEVIWDNKEDMTLIAQVTPPLLKHDLKLQLTLNQKTFLVPLLSTPPFKLGRNQEADIHINSPFVSRIHALIEYSRNKYTLIDNSSNGTFIFLNDTQKTIFLHRETIPLTGSGTISLGKPIEAENDTLLSFQLITS